jgi:hypothetical protein
VASTVQKNKAVSSRVTYSVRFFWAPQLSTLSEVNLDRADRQKCFRVSDTRLLRDVETDGLTRKVDDDHDGRLARVDPD